MRSPAAALAATLLFPVLAGCIHRPTLLPSPVELLDAGRAPKTTALSQLNFTLGATAEIQQVLYRGIEVTSPDNAKRSFRLPDIRQAMPITVIPRPPPRTTEYSFTLPRTAHVYRLDTEAGRFAQALEDRYARLVRKAIADHGFSLELPRGIPPIVRGVFSGYAPIANLWGWDAFMPGINPGVPVGVGAKWQQITEAIDFRIVYTLLGGGTLEGSWVRAEFSQHLGPRALPELGLECTSQLDGKDDTLTTPSVPIAQRKGTLTLALHCRRLAPGKPGDPPENLTLHTNYDVTTSPNE